jgi:apolipoprotein N-acyltransferase
MKSMLWPILALLVICLSWGFWRVSNFPCEQGRPIKVALVQHEADELDRLVSFSLTPPAGAADLVVWPEYCFQVPLGTEQLYLNLVRQKLYGDKALFVIGAFDYDEDATPPQIHDYAWVFSSQEGVYGRYDKLHPIPFIERYLKGNPDPRPVNSPLGKLGLQVCYDLDFENGSRLMAKQGAEILAVPNMDPLQWGRIQHQQHSNMAPFRAVEEGLWVVRAASSGFSQIIDPVGRVLYSLPVGENGALTGQAWLDNRATFYNRAGWLLAPLCMILTGFMMVWFLVRMIFEKKKLKR